MDINKIPDPVSLVILKELVVASHELSRPTIATALPGNAIWATSHVHFVTADCDIVVLGVEKSNSMLCHMMNIIVQYFYMAYGAAKYNAMSKTRGVVSYFKTDDTHVILVTYRKTAHYGF